jgi:DNA polymerase III subunit epsilon
MAMDVQQTISNLDKLNFTAIDFETANEQRASICSMGYAKVRAGKIVETNHILIKPKDARFSPLNISIHQITEDMVENCPQFCDIWPILQPIIKDEILVAHNASFDIDALKQTLHIYGLELPNFKYMCTHKLAQIAFDELENYKLTDIAQYFGLEFQHHNSEADAIISAITAIAAIPRVPQQILSYKVDELTSMISKKGSSNKDSALDSIFKGKKINKNLLSKLDTVNEGSIFYNRKVVLTGDLKSFNRNDAAARLHALGAKINTSISAKTNIVIVGANAGPSKMNKIEELINSGNNIRIIYEDEFIGILNTEG